MLTVSGNFIGFFRTIFKGYRFDNILMCLRIEQKIGLQFQEPPRFVFKTKINKSFLFFVNCFVCVNKWWKERKEETKKQRKEKEKSVIVWVKTVSGCQFILCNGIVGIGVANNDDINRILEASPNPVQALAKRIMCTATTAHDTNRERARAKEKKARKKDLLLDFVSIFPHSNHTVYIVL